MNKEDAVSRAKAFADQRGWTWREPIHAETYRPWFIMARRWRVVSNYEARGMNVRVELDDATGEVLSGNYIPR
jgi:hypothetical protein